MEGRKSSSSWPWKRKFSQNNSGASSPKTQAMADRQPPKQHTTTASQQSEEVLSNPNYERRSQSLSETLLNKNLVQQHSKIAEEAVSGWQKAEAEVACYKKQLEEALKQKTEADDRLTNCMKEISMLREEHERVLHDAILKSREWEKTRAQLESKVAEVEQQIVAAEAENNIIVSSLQERDTKIAEVTQFKVKAEGEVRSLYIKMSGLLKENSRLKYEVHLLNKEKEIRSDKREYRRMAAEISHKKNLQSHEKQISNLEEECQRLRDLVSKRVLINSTDPTSYNAVESSSSPQMFSGETKLTKETVVTRSINDLQMGKVMNMNETVYPGIDMKEGRSNKQKASATLEAQLEVLRTASCDLESNLGCKDEVAPNDDAIDDDDVSVAQSWASAMIAELAHFKKDKALVTEAVSLNSMDHLSNMGIMADYSTELESMASCSEHNNDRRSLKQEIEIRAAAGRKQWNSKYEKDMIRSNNISSRFCGSVSEIVKLVKALAHPLLYATTNMINKTETNSVADCKSTHTNVSAPELSESDFQLHIDKLVLIKEKAAELRSTSVSWIVVEFLEELCGVLTRLVKIALYKNAQRDGCSDDDFDDNVSDMSGLATSISQRMKRDNYTATRANNLSFNDMPPNSLGNHFLSSIEKEPKKIPLRKEKEASKEHDNGGENERKHNQDFMASSKEIQTELKTDFNGDKPRKSNTPVEAIQEKKSSKEKEVVETSNGRRKKSESPLAKEEVSFVEKEGMTSYTVQPHPSLNSKHLITQHNSPTTSPSSKLFDFNSKHLKTAIRSTISKTMSKSNVSSTAAVPPRKSKPSNKLLNRLLSFS